MNLPPRYDRVRLAVILTCYNRKVQTLACLARLRACQKPHGMRLDVVLMDDGSTDGTNDAVAETYPDTIILRGDGTLFWNRGMQRAFQWALDRGYDYYLWLNDDTLLAEDAIERLMATDRTVRQQSRPGIIVGSICDPQTGVQTYGGFVRRQRWRPLKFYPLAPGTVPIACDVMNANCVLIPSEVAAVVGNFDWTFEHAMGDFDYALRTRQKGFPIWIAPGFFGTCKVNLTNQQFLDRSLPLSRRFRSIINRKNLPPSSWAHYAAKHSGFFWPAYWAWPYIKVFFSSLSARKPKIVKLIRGTTPPFIWRILASNYKNSKIYNSYQDALRASSSGGYENKDVVDLIVKKTTLFRDNLEERSEFDLGSLRTLIALAAAQTSNTFNVIDFGGGGGYHYYIANKVTAGKYISRWHVVETPAMAAAAHRLEDGKLRFFDNLEAATKELPYIHLVFTSGALPSVSDPLASLRRLTEIGAKYIFITRTPLNAESDTVVVVQNSLLSRNGPGELLLGYTERSISYPATFVSQEEFESTLRKNYHIRFKINEPDEDAVSSKKPIHMHGYFCELK